jgi:anti-anti-sigma factor
LAAELAELIDVMDIALWELDDNYRVVDLNQRAREIYGDGVIDQFCYYVAAKREDPCPNCPAKLVYEGAPSGRSEHRRMDVQGNEIYIDHLATPIKNEEGELTGALVLIIDITEHKKREQDLRRAAKEQARLREEIIATQQRIISELSIPVIPVWEGILVMPVVGSIDADRAHRITESLLNEIELKRAKIVIIDITGVPMVDTAVASALLQTADAARLLGAEAILVGITPAVAQTIVQLGVNLQSLLTKADLQSGVEYALQRQGKTVTLIGESPL